MQSVIFVNDLSVCKACLTKKDLVIVECDVVPQETCQVCEKSQSQMLLQGRPCCFGCYEKNKESRRPIVMQSMAQQAQSSVLSTRMSRPLESKNSKKAYNSLKQLRQSGLHLNNLRKKSYLHYIIKDSPKITWQAFLDKCWKKMPIMILTLYHQRLVGGFLSDQFDVNKVKHIDSDCGIFDVGKADPILQAIQNNKISVEGRTLHFGQPCSLRIHFDTMKFWSQSLSQHKQSFEIENLFIFRL